MVAPVLDPAVPPGDDIVVEGHPLYETLKKAWEAEGSPNKVRLHGFTYQAVDTPPRFIRTQHESDESMYGSLSTSRR